MQDGLFQVQAVVGEDQRIAPGVVAVFARGGLQGGYLRFFVRLDLREGVRAESGGQGASARIAHQQQGDVPRSHFRGGDGDRPVCFSRPQMRASSCRLSSSRRVRSSESKTSRHGLPSRVCPKAEGSSTWITAIDPTGMASRDTSGEETAGSVQEKTLAVTAAHKPMLALLSRRKTICLSCRSYRFTDRREGCFSPPGFLSHKGKQTSAAIQTEAGQGQSFSYDSRDRNRSTDRRPGPRARMSR